MRIGEVAARAGVSVRALRYYEEQDLLSADRPGSGHRRYSESAVVRVRFIQTLYAAGLTSRAIRQVLPFMDSGMATPELVRGLGDERERLQRRIEELTESLGRLDELIGLAEDLPVDGAGADGAGSSPPDRCADPWDWWGDRSGADRP